MARLALLGMQLKGQSMAGARSTDSILALHHVTLKWFDSDSGCSGTRDRFRNPRVRLRHGIGNRLKIVKRSSSGKRRHSFVRASPADGWLVLAMIEHYYRENIQKMRLPFALTESLMIPCGRTGRRYMHHRLAKYKNHDQLVGM
jgi:hypothetical protein